MEVAVSGLGECVWGGGGGGGNRPGRVCPPLAPFPP
eukprot:SAG25_NODE_2579_length_1518_cov_2.223397_1_plen_35_part_10